MYYVFINIIYMNLINTLKFALRFFQIVNKLQIFKLFLNLCWLQIKPNIFVHNLLIKTKLIMYITVYHLHHIVVSFIYLFFK